MKEIFDLKEFIDELINELVGERLSVEMSNFARSRLDEEITELRLRGDALIEALNNRIEPVRHYC